MTVVQLIKELQDVAAQGYGDANVIIEEEGLGYAGALIGPDTLEVNGARVTLTLVAERRADTST